MTGRFAVRLDRLLRIRWVITLISTLVAVLSISTATAAQPRWRTLPDTPELPSASLEGSVAINGAKIWYATFGSGEPVIMLHGGLANSDYWGHQVPELAKSYKVIVMDSRGHGRSTRAEQDFSYDGMSSDVVALMDHLNVSKAAIIGWSDGAIIGLKLAIRNPDRVSGVFAFGANSDPSGMHDLSDSKIFEQYLQRTREEYERLSPTPGEYDAFYRQMEKMWSSQPDIAKRDLRSIQVPVWIADGDHEEVIRRKDTLFIADNIPNSGLLIQPEVSHFSQLQDPHQFTEDVLCFLRTKGIGKQVNSSVSQGCRSD
ncbi:3-oxoadipate enol-lactonase 2 [Ensifer psoraleae]|uniref:alpha/beta fold hydrolase n=1 Tax=Sinorhizobium psoraleae TaxID=520838 RepID=UPI00156A252F|nr:alpha/beta hydrolase [Sinorhizobium psoraleae]NRP75405.1 3-oxoadipate enol-lactonase 2 [Sinorhizobium psoraleae]